MKKIIIVLLLLATVPLTRADAQIGLITGAITKVIQQIDLGIQRQQNKVIWMQDAQKTLENAMAQTHLNDIAQWTQKEQSLFSNYFDELKKVKDALTTFEEVTDIIQRQKELVSEYNTEWGLLRQDNHFTASELQSMGSVYTSILNESLQNIEQLTMVVTNFSTQMSDGRRLELIHNSGRNLDRNLSDLRSFNNQNAALSISRARDEQDATELRQLYGVN